MRWEYIGIAALLFAAAVLTNRRAGRIKRDQMPAFYAAPLLTTPEQTLYLRLKDALPNHIVMAQVALSQVARIQRSPTSITWENKTRPLVIDFVVCRSDFSIVAAIELDDSSHGLETRKRADANKDATLKAANIPIIRWTVKNMPDRFAIAQQLNSSP